MSRIRIGNQTNCNVPALKPFGFALEHGFDAFEWFSDYGSAGWNEQTFTAEKIDEIRRCGRDNDIRFSVHAPWRSDPTTVSGRDEILRSIGFARKICAKIVNLHLFPEYEPALFVQAILPLLAAAGEDIGISLENVPLCSPENINQVFSCLLDSGKMPVAAGLCLDIGHAGIFAETRGDFCAYLGRIAEFVPISHLHIHENDGELDQHLPLFTGKCSTDEEPVKKLISILKARGFSGSMIMEQWPSPPEILVATRSHLLDLLKESA